MNDDNTPDQGTIDLDLAWEAQDGMTMHWYDSFHALMGGEGFFTINITDTQEQQHG